MLKKAVHATANALGYQIQRKRDPIADMQRLLTGVKTPVIFDVGAHVGGVARQFRRSFPTSRVYAFEPFPESFARLKRNTSGDPNITALPFGLSDRNGTQTFHSNALPETNSLLASHPHGSVVWGAGLLDTVATVEAEFKTMESAARDLGVTRIDLLKMDVQGAEHLVMAGAGAIPISVIYAEAMTQKSYAGQLRFDRLLEAYYRRGFDLFNIYNLCNTPDGLLRCVDVVFVRH